MTVYEDIGKATRDRLLRDGPAADRLAPKIRISRYFPSASISQGENLVGNHGHLENRVENRQQRPFETAIR